MTECNLHFRAVFSGMVGKLNAGHEEVKFVKVRQTVVTGSIVKKL